MSDLSVSLDLLHRRQVTIIVYSAAFGTILIDLVSTFPTEVKYIFYPDLKRIHRRWPTLPTLLLLIPRVLTIPLVTLVYILMVEQKINCRSVWKGLLAIYATLASNAFCIFIVRLIAIRNSKRPMICFLVLLLVAHTAAVIYWLFFSTFAPEPFHLSPEITLCSGLQLPAWTWKLCIGFATADLLILCLTLFDQDWRTTKIKFGTVYNVWRSGDSSITQRFYSDTIFYFSIQIVYLYLEAIWIHHYAHDPIYGILPVPIHYVLLLVVSPRVLRSLKLHSAKSCYHETSSSQKSSSSHQKFHDISGRTSAAGREQCYHPHRMKDVEDLDETYDDKSQNDSYEMESCDQPIALPFIQKPAKSFFKSKRPKTSPGRIQQTKQV